MISIYKNAVDSIPERNLSEQSYFDGVKTGQWQDAVLDYRTGKLAKKLVPAVTISGVFSVRKIDKLIEHSNLICLDIDAKDQICQIDIETIKNDPYTYCVHKSLGGKGYAVFVKIDGARHLDAYLGLENYYFVNHSIILDKSCKDISRLRFVSFDPELFLNEKAKIFKKYIPKKEIEKTQFKTITVKSDFDDLVNQAAPKNLFEDYNDYISLAFALVSEFGEDGRNYFHTLSASSGKYNQSLADKHYSIAMKRNGAGITIASVYYIFKQAGLKIISEKTEQIKKIVKLSDNPKEKLIELGIEDNENIVDKLEAENKSNRTEIDDIIDVIKFNEIKFNEITRKFELKGEEMDDRLLSKFYQSVWTKVNEKISKEKIFTLIQNRDNTPSYNPIKDWFEKYKNLQHEDEFKKVVECFDVDMFIPENPENLIVSDFVDVFMKKWLLGLISSAFGTYSLLILVLSGQQNRMKTEFFRNLLPLELRSFYSESNLDEGKDSEILMCKKWIIMDDEFGGKSKRDSTKLKRLSSQQTFSIRMPYGRFTEDLNRLAVLCGTSNDAEIINDPTGNRRIIPINVNSIDIHKFKKIDKNKLFIQLYNEWKSDPTGWFLTAGEIEFLNKSTVQNTEVMAEEELISKHVKELPNARMTCTDLKLALEKYYPSLKTNTKKIGQALKKCGFEQKVVKINDKVLRIYEIFIDYTA